MSLMAQVFEQANAANATYTAIAGQTFPRRLAGRGRTSGKHIQVSQVTKPGGA